MRKVLLILLFINVCLLAKGQLALDWERHTTGGFINMITDHSGGTYLFDNTGIVRYNASGYVDWRIPFPSLDQLSFYSFPTNIKLEKSNSIYFLNNYGNAIYINKVDTDGNIVYKTFLDNLDLTFITTQSSFQLKSNNEIVFSTYKGQYLYDSILEIIIVDSNGVIKSNTSKYINSDLEFINSLTDDSYNTYIYGSEWDSIGNGYNTLRKIDKGGKIEWTRYYSNLGSLVEMGFSPDSSIILLNSPWIEKISLRTGATKDSVSYLPDEGSSNDYIDNKGNIFIQTYLDTMVGLSKYNSNLKLLFNQQPRIRQSFSKELFVDQNSGNIYRTVQVVDSGGAYGLFLEYYVDKIDSNGNLISSMFFSDTSDHYQDIVPSIDDKCNIYVGANLFFSFSFPGSNIQLVKFCTACGYGTIYGTIYNDVNKNCNPDSAERHLINRLVEMTPGNIYTISDSSGNYSFHADTGSYAVHEILPNHYWKFNCDSTYSFSIDSVNQVRGNLNFGNVINDTINDVAIHVAASPMQPGYDSWITLAFYNNGTTDLNATVTLQLDSSFSYVSSTDSPLYRSGDTMSWNLGLLKANNYGQIDLLIHVSSFDTLNQPFKITSWIYPVANDAYPANNTDSISDFIGDSYDPNEKLLYPLASRISGSIEPEIPVTYQINFQNTGTDTARTIMVQDVLDPQFDITTFSMNTAIKPYSLQIVNGRTLQWTFNNILMPDSGQSQAGSHGFLSYSIAAKPNNTHSDITIKNTASIYFDYNKPVGTDTVKLLERGQPILYTTTSLLIYPNPSANESYIQYTLPQNSRVNFELFDLLGRRLITQDLGNQPEGLYNYKIKLQEFSSGIYIVRLKTVDGYFTSRLSVAK